MWMPVAGMKIKKASSGNSTVWSGGPEMNARPPNNSFYANTKHNFFRLGFKIAGLCHGGHPAETQGIGFQCLLSPPWPSHERRNFEAFFPPLSSSAGKAPIKNSQRTKRWQQLFRHKISGRTLSCFCLSKPAPVRYCHTMLRKFCFFFGARDFGVAASPRCQPMSFNLKDNAVGVWERCYPIRGTQVRDRHSGYTVPGSPAATRIEKSSRVTLFVATTTKYPQNHKAPPCAGLK